MFGSILGSVKSLGIGVFAAKQLFEGFAGTVEALIGPALDAQKVQSQTNAVLASTKGAAGMSAQAVDDLANSLSRVTPFEDETVKSAENMLLTFTNIGKNVFPDATETVLNMAQALGEDTVGAAVQLGKALQDPITGATALRRVGVALTEQQQEQIKSLVALGDVEGAQKIILTELQTEFGGAAKAAGETAAGQFEILKTQIGNVSEAIGGPLIGVLGSLAKSITPVVSQLADALPEALGQLASGDFKTPFDNLLASVSDFGQQMFGAGFNLIQQLAGGIVDGANTLITDAVNVVADIIASFLIGNSPPPEGPLSKIEEGGRNLVAAYANSIGTANLGPIEDFAGRVNASLTDFKGLESEGKQIEAQIHLIGKAIHENQGDIELWKANIEGIKKNYEDQISPLQRQLDILKNAVDLTKEQQDLADQVTNLDLKRQEIAAQGDPIKRAELQNKLDELRAQQDTLSIEKERADIHAKLKAGKDVSPQERQSLQIRLQELETRQQIAALTDRSQLAEIKQKEQALALTEEDRHVAEKKAELETKQKELPLEAQIRDLKLAEQDALVPAQAQLKIYEDQGKVLQDQQKQWSELKATISDAAALVKPAAGAGGAAAAKISTPSVTPSKALTPADLKLEDVGAKIGQQMLAGIQSSVTKGFPTIMATAIGGAAGFAFFGPLGAIAGGIFGEKLGEGLQAKIPDLAARLTAFGQIAGEIFGQMAKGNWDLAFREIDIVLSANLPRIIKTLEGWGKAFVDWVEMAIPPLLDALGKLADEFLTWASDQVQPILDQLGVWGQAFVDWIGPLIPPFLSELQTVAVAAAGWVRDQAGPLLDQLGTWAAAFLEWVGPQIPPLLAELGKLWLAMVNWTVTVALPGIILKLVEWGAAFTAWVAPRIPVILAELGKLGMALLNWIDDSLTPMKETLQGWGAAFLDWVKDDVEPFLPNKLSAVMTSISKWVTDTTGNVMTEAGKLGAGFVKGIQDGVGGALDGFKNWITDNLANALPQWVRDVLQIHSPSGVFQDIGMNLMSGLEKGIMDKWPDVETVIKRLMGMFADLGANVPGGPGDWLRAALAITGTSQDWFGDLFDLMKMESGGDPRAQNPTHVIVNGVDLGQAAGLMQMLPGTFAAHMLAGFGNIWNPIDNAISSIRYIKDTYGSVHNIDRSPAGGYLGYAEGGVVPGPPGMGQWAYVHGGETITPPGQGGGGDTYVFNFPNYVGSRSELVNMVKSELTIDRRRNGKLPWES